VGKLDGRRGSLQADEPRYPLQRSDVRVLPDTEIVRADPAARLHCCCLCNDKPGSPDCAAAEMNQVPVCGKSVIA
jgi:hypothetical protein